MRGVPARRRYPVPRLWRRSSHEFLIAAPEPVAAAATDLARVGSTLGAANAAAVAPTSSVIAAGADEVSASIAVQQDVLHHDQRAQPGADGTPTDR